MADLMREHGYPTAMRALRHLHAVINIYFLNQYVAAKNEYFLSSDTRMNRRTVWVSAH